MATERLPGQVPDRSVPSSLAADPGSDAPESYPDMAENDSTRPDESVSGEEEDFLSERPVPGAASEAPEP